MAKTLIKYILILNTIVATACARAEIVGDSCSCTTGNKQVTLSIDVNRTLGSIPDILSNINIWDYHVDWLGAAGSQDTLYFKKKYPFARYIQIMQATGGDKHRDLFINPFDRNTPDDYKFDSLITVCRNIIRQGLKPHIKTGNVPVKYSGKSLDGEFSGNLNAPNDFNVYYNYIKALAEKLVDEFGLDEVKTWKWGVLTEYENKDWFNTENDSQKTKINYFKLYDYTAAALQSVVGADLYIGAHSMTVSNGMWDEREFIDHCAYGINYYTGKKGSPLHFLSCSFYDKKPGEYAKKTLPETIAVVRDRAGQDGFNNLEYGIDEGRILSGVDDKPLTSRISARTYQAAYDARMYKTMLDNKIDYFSSWSFTTGGMWGGVPSVSYHTAILFNKMIGAARLPVNKIVSPRNSDIDAIASFDTLNNKIYVMCYNFCNSIVYNGTANLILEINTNNMLPGKVSVTKWVIDDSSNYYDEWMQDYKNNGIEDSDFSWSSESVSVEDVLFKNTALKQKFYSGIDKYMKAAELHPAVETKSIANNILKLSAELQANTVVFYEISKF